MRFARSRESMERCFPASNSRTRSMTSRVVALGAPDRDHLRLAHIDRRAAVRARAPQWTADHEDSPMAEAQTPDRHAARLRAISMIGRSVGHGTL